MFYIKCHKCSGSIILLILSSGPLISSVGIITDLNEVEIMKFQKSKKIQEEDILNLHQLIKAKNFCIKLKNL